jgi:hypothetical protein
MNRTFGKRRDVFLVMVVLALVTYSLLSNTLFSKLAYAPDSASQQNKQIMNEDTMHPNNKIEQLDPSRAAVEREVERAVVEIGPNNYKIDAMAMAMVKEDTEQLNAIGSNFANVRMPDVPQKTKEQRSYMKAEQFSSACLLIMDDNHWLVEFLAYHYFTLNLREIIVTTDPRSRTSPESVLDRWKDRINITVWNDTNVMGGKEKSVLRAHRSRQNNFFRLCQREFHARNHSWTITLDTDERVFINPQVSQPGHELYRGLRARPNISEAGSILKFLVQEKERNNGTVCLQMARTSIGSWNDTCNNDTAVKLPNNFHADDFPPLASATKLGVM